MGIKSLIIGVFIVFLIVAVSGCTSNTGSSSISSKNYTWNGVTFSVPSDWKATETAGQLNSNVRFDNPQKTVAIVVQIEDNSLYKSLQEIQSQRIDYAKSLNYYVSDRNYTVNGKTVYEFVQAQGGDQNNRMVQIFMEPKSGQYYSVRLIGTKDVVDQNRQYLDLVVNSLTAQ